MNAMLVSPRATPTTNADGKFGADGEQRHRNAEASGGHAHVAQADLLAPRRRQCADERTRADDGEQQVNVSVPPCRSRSTNSGSVVLKLKASVPMTAIIMSGISSSGTLRT